jgi:hypothetical protein
LRVFAIGAGFVRHGGVFGVKFVVGGDFLEFEQALEGAATDQVEPHFVAMDEVETAGIVGQGGEGGGEAFGLRGGGMKLVFEFLVEGGGFDGPEAAQAPNGEDHFLDQSLGGRSWPGRRGGGHEGRAALGLGEGG